MLQFERTPTREPIAREPVAAFAAAEKIPPAPQTRLSGELGIEAVSERRASERAAFSRRESALTGAAEILGHDAAPLGALSKGSAPPVQARKGGGKKKKMSPEAEQAFYRKQAIGERGKIDAMVGGGMEMPSYESMTHDDNLLEAMFLPGRGSDMEKCLRLMQRINHYEQAPSAEAANGVFDRIAENQIGGGFDLDAMFAQKEAPEDAKVFVGEVLQRELRDKIAAGDLSRNLFGTVRADTDKVVRADFMPYLLQPGKDGMEIDRKAQNNFLEMLRKQMETQKE